MFNLHLTKSLANNKHSSLLCRFISYEENGVLRIPDSFSHEDCQGCKEEGGAGQDHDQGQFPRYFEAAVVICLPELIASHASGKKHQKL